MKIANWTNDPLWKKLGYSSYQEYENSKNNPSGRTQTPSLNAYKTIASQSPKFTTVGAGLLQNSTGGLQKPGGAKNNGGGTANGSFSFGGGVGTLQSIPTQSNPGLPPQKNSQLSTEKYSVNDLRGVESDTSGSSAASQSAGQGAGTGFSARYQGNDFLEWYRTNYGSEFDSSKGFSRPDGMSDVDWAIGNSLYVNYLTGRNLKEAYDADVSQTNERYRSALDALDTNRRNAQQNASITLDKLMKYLPIQLKAQGLGGLGVSETSALQAYNNYQNNMGEIAGNYNSNRAALDTNREQTLSDLQRAYQNNKTNLDISTGEQSQSIFDKYYQADKQAKDTAYSEAYNTLGRSASSSADELLSYVEQFKGRVSDEQYNTLVQQAQQVAQANAQRLAENDRQQAYDAIVDNIQYMLNDAGNFTEDGLKLTEEGKNRMLQYLEQNKDALGEQTYNAYKSQIETMSVYTAEQKQADDQQTQAEKDKHVITGQDTIEYGGRYYRIQSEVDSNANEIRHNNDFKEQLENLGFTDPYDKNIPNGTTITFKSDASGRNRIGLEDFVYDASDWRNWIPFYGAYNWVNNWANLEKRTMTYYNGKWYFSSEV